MQQKEKKSGIWLDREQAFIIIFENEMYKTKKIQSSIEDFRPLGGSRSKVPYGPMEKISEKKYLERRKHQEQKYFEEIKKEILDCNQVYLFGPAEIKHKLQNHLLRQHHFRNCTIDVETTDTMTDPQKIAKAKRFLGF